MKTAKIMMIFGIVILLFGCTTELDNEHEEDHFVEISGSDMKQLTIQEIADLWDINPDTLLESIISQFDLRDKYTTQNTLDELREEYKFSPAQIKEIADEIKLGGEHDRQDQS